MFWQYLTKVPKHSNNNYMWSQEILTILPESQTLNRNEILDFLKSKGENISRQSLCWIIDEGIKNQLLYKVGPDSYSRKDDSRKFYNPVYSDAAKELSNVMEKQYPELQFSVFETLLLNEFVNHMISMNCIVLFVEKALCAFTFDFLNERYPGKVLYNSKAEDIERYKKENTIILANAVSEAPANKQKPHDITLEKLLVDCVADKSVKTLIPSSEISNIFENSRMLYRIDINKIKRYSKRRSVWERVEPLLTSEEKHDN